MSCFTVNKLKEVVGGKSFLTAVKASPSPKRKAGAVKKNDSCKESSTTNTDFVYHKSPQPVTKRNQEQVSLLVCQYNEIRFGGGIGRAWDNVGMMHFRNGNGLKSLKALHFCRFCKLQTALQACSQVKLDCL